jgi:hypothetical protein
MVTMSRSTNRGGRTWFVLRTPNVGSQDEAESVLQTARSVGAVGPLVLHLRTSDPTA